MKVYNAVQGILEMTKKKTIKEKVEKFKTIWRFYVFYLSLGPKFAKIVQMFCFSHKTKRLLRCEPVSKPIPCNTTLDLVDNRLMKLSI